jgi:hypothetical protein
MRFRFGELMRQSQSPEQLANEMKKRNVKSELRVMNVGETITV